MFLCQDTLDPEGESDDKNVLLERIDQHEGDGQNVQNATQEHLRVMKVEQRNAMIVCRAHIDSSEGSTVC